MTHSSSKRYTTILMYASFILLSFVFAFPLLFMIMSGFKPDVQIFRDLHSFRAFLPVGDISWDNYAGVFAKTNIELFFLNSVIITVSTVVLGLLVNSMLAFALARLAWKGKSAVLALVIALLTIPFETIAVPLLLLVSELPWIGFDGFSVVLEHSWLNSYRVQILPFVGNAFSVFLFYQFFLDIPKDFDEAAYMDGASPWQIYFRVIVPMSGPVFATVAILQFLLMWNQYLWPIMAVQGENVRPIMPGIQQFFGRQTSWGEVMAYATMITLPVVTIFLIFQKWFVRSVVSSGIKG